MAGLVGDVPVSGVERKWDFEGGRSVVDPYRDITLAYWQPVAVRAVPCLSGNRNGPDSLISQQPRDRKAVDARPHTGQRRRSGCRAKVACVITIEQARDASR
jgi:hypothetical protein